VGSFRDQTQIKSAGKEMRIPHDRTSEAMGLRLFSHGFAPLDVRIGQDGIKDVLMAQGWEN
jgi:hypothetical protein